MRPFQFSARPSAGERTLAEFPCGKYFRGWWFDLLRVLLGDPFSVRHEEQPVRRVKRPGGGCRGTELAREFSRACADPTGGRERSSWQLLTEGRVEPVHGGRGRSGSGGRGGGCPACHRAWASIGRWHPGQSGAGAGGGSGAGGGGAESPVGSCQAWWCAVESTGACRSSARTRLARTLAAGWSQPNVRTRAKPRGRTCCKKRRRNSQGSSRMEVKRRVLLSR